jgi:hypothetical protein
VNVSTAFEQEFATVNTLLSGTASTRRVDSLTLCWVKMEKQLRRLFSFLVFQSPAFSRSTGDGIVQAVAERRDIFYVESIRLIDSILAKPMSSVVGSPFVRLRPELDRIRKYRNKILHGQPTGMKITARELEKDIDILKEWVLAVGSGYVSECGYDGLGRGSFKKATVSSVGRVSRTFGTIAELRAHIDGTLRKQPRP